MELLVLLLGAGFINPTTGRPLASAFIDGVLHRETGHWNNNGQFRDVLYRLAKDTTTHQNYPAASALRGFIAHGHFGQPDQGGHGAVCQRKVSIMQCSLS